MTWRSDPSHRAAIVAGMGSSTRPSPNEPAELYPGFVLSGERARAWERLVNAAKVLGAAIERSDSGEAVVWTGVAETLSGTPVEWCDECGSGEEVPEAGCTACLRGIKDTPEMSGADTSYRTLIGHYVDIVWVDREGEPASAAGVLEDLLDRDGERIALLDWGYGVDLDARGLEIADWGFPCPHNLESGHCQASGDQAAPGSDYELPGMWEYADFTGGQEVVRGPNWARQSRRGSPVTAGRDVLAPEDTVGHDDRCDASPGADRPCRCAERAAVALLTSLGYEVQEPPAAQRYEPVPSGNREILRCADCGTIWRSPASRPPTNPCIPPKEQRGA